MAVEATTLQADAEPRPRIERGKIPGLKDPRWPFAGILTLYGVLGFTAFGFNRTPAQMLLTVAAGMMLEVVLALLIRRKLVFPLSAYISCCSLALLLNYSHQNWLLFLPVFLTIGSKYVLTFGKRHILNPSMFGVSASLLLTNELITAAPAYQWAGGSITMSAFIIMSALMLFVFKIRKNWLIFSFLFFYALQTLLRAWILRHHIPMEMLFVGTVASPPFFIFTFYMITDPATSPKTPKGQVLFALALTLVDLYLHVYESVFTFFYAALALGMGKYLFLHARRLWREGLGAYVRTWTSWEAVKAPAVVGAIGLAMLADYHFLIRPSLSQAEPGFTMTEIPPEQSGLGAEFGEVLEQTDARLLHVSKWIMSVGNAVAVGDVDGDGLLDVFLTQPLHAPAHRAALFRNRGDFTFERFEVEALARYRTLEGLKQHGAAVGGTFVDYDGDGDQDLLVAVAFGPSLLLQNQLAESGAPALVDVTEEVGLGGEHHTSLAATFLDYDRDAKLDLFVANAMTTHLDRYDPPRPFNIFDLPAPEREGDRRALRFMHNGWHDADNGGLNALYRAGEDGTFAPAPGVELPETRWSLAVCTVDFNHDGWTDLYVANDFGPDRLYLNRGGEGFESVVSEDYGEVGKDTYKGMNCSAADFDRNAFQDVYVSNVHHALQAEGSLLWMVRPGGDAFRPEFSDEATQRGALNERRFAWGAGAGDLNNDGWFDILQANGMLDDDVDPRGYERKDYWYVNHKLMQSGPEIHTYADMWGDIRGRTIYPNEARRALLNLGDEAPGYFADVAREIGVDDPGESRGVALADLDNDGDLDLLVTNQHADTSLYRNDLIRAGEEPPGDANFVGLTLRGDGARTHRSAVGTRVKLSWEGVDGRPVEVWDEVSLLTGFSGQGDPRVHVGLGAARGPVAVEVHWYGAGIERFEVPGNAYHTIAQGAGQ